MSSEAKSDNIVINDDKKEEIKQEQNNAEENKTQNIEQKANNIEENKNNNITKEEEEKKEEVHYDKQAAETIDNLSKLFIWASKDKSRLIRMRREIDAKKEKIINAFAEILQPELYKKTIEVMSSMGIPLPNYDKQLRPPDPEPDRNIALEQSKKIIFESDSVKDKETAFKKLEKFYSLSREERINYLSKVMDIIINKYKESGPVDALQLFVVWITADEGEHAYDGMIALPFFARPQYSDVWVRFVSSTLILLDSLLSAFS